MNNRYIIHPVIIRHLIINGVISGASSLMIIKNIPSNDFSDIELTVPFIRAYPGIKKYQKFSPNIWGKFKYFAS